MRIVGKMETFESEPDIITVIGKDKQMYYIKIEEPDIELDGSFSSNDAYFLRGVSDDFEYETKCMDELADNILEDFESGIIYDAIIFSDEAGEITITFVDDETSGKRNAVFSAKWNDIKMHEDTDKSENEFNNNFNSNEFPKSNSGTYSDKPNFYNETADNDKLTVVSNKTSVTDFSKYKLEDFPSFQEVDSIGESPSSAERYEKAKAQEKTKERTVTKSMGGDDLEK